MRSDLNKDRLLHELQVHQIELEMQNEELQQARGELNGMVEKYIDLYDFAPVGYMTLDKEGMILSVNLTALGMLCIEHSHLIKKYFGQFVSDETQPTFNALIRKGFEEKTKDSSEVMLLNEYKPLFVRIDVSLSGDGKDCLAVIVDITDIKRAEELIKTIPERKETLLKEIHHRVNNQCLNL